MKPKPHTAHNQLVLALQKVQRDNGKLSLSLFKRVKQLGSGDVGLVDLVQLQVAQMRYSHCLLYFCLCCSHSANCPVFVSAMPKVLIWNISLPYMT